MKKLLILLMCIFSITIFAQETNTKIQITKEDPQYKKYWSDYYKYKKIWYELSKQIKLLKNEIKDLDKQISKVKMSFPLRKTKGWRYREDLKTTCRPGLPTKFEKKQGRVIYIKMTSDEARQEIIDGIEKKQDTIRNQIEELEKKFKTNKALMDSCINAYKIYMKDKEVADEK